ncbi:hypothetical protein [Nonomuraea longicatena]|uniref:Uncharacterized protein n=1 Tax=Nonomuraea longicatena TaxID=83682 RepID=A0ABP3ZDR2_9ACTN
MVDGLILTRGQLESWAGRQLTDGEIDRLNDAIPCSSTPDAIGMIVAAFDVADEA